MNTPYHPPEVRLERLPDGSWQALLSDEPDVPMCDFCTSPDPTTDYDCDDFPIGVIIADGYAQEHWSRGGFLACKDCAMLIDTSSYGALIVRMIRVWKEKHPDEADGPNEDAFVSVVAGFAVHRGRGRRYTPKEERDD